MGFQATAGHASRIQITEWTRCYAGTQYMDRFATLPDRSANRSLHVLHSVDQQPLRSKEQTLPLSIRRPAAGHRPWRCQSRTGLGIRDPKCTSVRALRRVGLAGGVPISCTTKYSPAGAQAFGGPSRVPFAVLTVVAAICTHSPAGRHTSSAIRPHGFWSRSNSVRTTPDLAAVKSLPSQRPSRWTTSQGY